MNAARVRRTLASLGSHPSRLWGSAFVDLAPVLALLALLLLSACTLPGNAAPIIKLGVIAPFEGRGRALGYAVLPAIKAAAAESNAAAALGPYRVTVVAFNDSLDPATARQQAEALALDPDVIGVVGPFSPETAAAAVPILARRGIPVQPVALPNVEEEDLSEAADQAKEAARALLRTLAPTIQAHGRPPRPAPAP